MSRSKEANNQYRTANQDRQNLYLAHETASSGLRIIRHGVDGVMVEGECVVFYWISLVTVESQR